MLPRITPIAIASHSPPNSYEDLRTYGSCQAVGGLACLFRSITRGWISALLSALGRSHCPCTAIHWGRTFSWRLQHGRTGSSALWLCRSHYRGIGSEKSRERARTSANDRGLQQPFVSTKSFCRSCLRNLANFGELLRTERVFFQ